MSFQDCGGSSSSVPSWAQRANEPLVPTLDVQAVKKDVQRDLKEIKKASDEIAKLGKKKGHNSGQQLLAVSERTRELARGTSRRLRDALSLAPEGSADHQVLSGLSEDFRAALKRFQHEAEAAAPGPVSPAAPPSGAAGSSRGPSMDIEVGVGGMRPAAPSTDGPTGGALQEQLQQQAQIQAVSLNDSIIREREEDITTLHRTVQEVSEIFQDLALLVDEQGTHIDNIQTNIETAARQTTKGVQQLASASRSQKRNRSRMCCAAVVLIFVIVCLILILHFAMKVI